MKTNERKVRECLKCVKEFSCRFDLGNRKYLPIFLGVFGRTVKVKYTFCSGYNFRFNCTRGQLNKEGGGELHEIKRCRDKTEIGKEII